MQNDRTVLPVILHVTTKNIFFNVGLNGRFVKKIKTARSVLTSNRELILLVWDESLMDESLYRVNMKLKRTGGVGYLHANFKSS